MSRAAAYVSAALDREIARIVEAPRSDPRTGTGGGRHNATLHAAGNVGEIVGALERVGSDLLTFNAADAALLRAAVAAGHPQRDAAAAIRHGLTRGMQNPRELPPAVLAELHGLSPLDVLPSPSREVEPGPEPIPERDPRQLEEARALWGAADPSPATHTALRRYCIARGYGEIGALRLGQLGMIRGAPDWPCDGYPAWARFKDGEGSSLPGAGWRILTPIHNALGDLVDVRFRWAGVEADNDRGWRPTSPRFAAKTMAGRGVGRMRGTAWCPCPAARALLEDGPCARPGELRPGVRWDGRVWLVEGDGDAWAAASALARKRPPADGWPAVIAYAPGTWTPEIAARLPDAADVVIFPDPDNGGERMARGQVLPTLDRQRVRVVDLGASDG